MGALAGIGAILGGAGSLFGGLFGANATGKATQQYIDALKQAQTFLQGQEQEGLNNYQPYLNAGGGAARTLADLTATPGQGLLTPWTRTFTAPTAEEAAQTPGFQFQLNTGINAMQNSAAARGGLLSGRTLADLNTYAQGLASENYQNVFNNALTQYQSAYQTFQNNQNNTYSRLMGLSNLGLQGAQGAGNLISGIGGDIASLYGQMGAARAQGTIGQANALGSIFPGLSSSLTNYLLLSKLGTNSGGGAGGGGMTPPPSTGSWEGTWWGG